MSLIRRLGRQRPAAAVLAALAIVALLAGRPPAAYAATAACPPDPLLVEAILAADSAFVGEVTESQSDTLQSGFLVEATVQEIWHGPDLAPHVVVNDHRLEGVPAETGGRYLFIADVVDEGDPDAAATHLQLGPCGQALSLTPELAVIRPPDARVMLAAGEVDPESRSNPAASPWLDVGLAILAVLLAASAAMLIIRPPRTLARWVPWTAAVAAIASGAAAVAMIGSPGAVPTGLESPDATPAPTTASAGETEDPTLVVRLEELTMMGGRVVSVHADGRLLTHARGVGMPVLHEQRLSPIGLELITAELDATDLLGDDAPATATYAPTLLPGAEPPGRDGFSYRITTGDDETIRVVDFVPILSGEAQYFAPSAEIERLDGLAQRLLAPDDWLPDDAWVQREPQRYVASRFKVSATEFGAGMGSPELDLDALAWPTTPLGEIAAVRDESGRLVRCIVITASEATEILGAVAAARDDVSLSLSAAQTIVHVWDATADVGHVLQIDALFPDQSACPNPVAPIAGQLGPDVIALVRVHDLLLREGPGESFTAVDALRAGERVRIVAGPTVADSMDWYEVRQGPGDLRGWVSAGPPNGAPWIVAIGSGAIAFHHGGFDGQPAVRSMQADGSQVTSLADGSPVAWSPDGRRILLTRSADGPAGSDTMFVVEADGSGLRHLADGHDAVWSPDGASIAFVRFGDESAIFLVDAAGGEPRRLVSGSSPAWSPDGARIAFIRSADVATGGEGSVAIPQALWVVDVATVEATRLTEDSLENQGGRPSWAPDGSRIAFGANTLVDPDGRNLTRLHGTATFDLGGDPWSPDGEELVMFEDGDVVLQAVDTGSRRIVVPAGAGHPLQFRWSPDGTSLAFAVGTESSVFIYTVGVVSGEPIQIGPSGSQFPLWQPIVSHGLD